MYYPGVKSKELFTKAKDVIPGGVNSPVRAFGSVDGEPLFIARAEGPYVWDEDGRRYLDYVGSWGPMILGHNSYIIRDAIGVALDRGTSFGAPTDVEVEIAELIVSNIGSVERVRMVNSGTEATMSALRLARAYTKRSHIIKFNGCYHGHADSLLVSAGSGVATCGIASSPGVPEEIAALTLSVEYNDLSMAQAAVKRVGGDSVAAIIVEPVAGNMGLVLPEPGFLEGLRVLCDTHGIVLIFDEVMSGFRVGWGGAQDRFGITPDLTCLGKVIGAGLPVGAFGGKAEIMDLLAPEGPVYQAGTLSGNPLAMTAGLAMLHFLEQHNPYPLLEERATLWALGMKAVGEEAGVPLQACHCGSMLGFSFSETPIRNFSDAKGCNADLFKRFFHEMLERGVYLAPSPFEAGFLSVAHDIRHIDRTIEAARNALNAIS